MLSLYFRKQIYNFKSFFFTFCEFFFCNLLYFKWLTQTEIIKRRYVNILIDFLIRKDFIVLSHSEKSTVWDCSAVFSWLALLSLVSLLNLKWKLSEEHTFECHNSNNHLSWLSRDFYFTLLYFTVFIIYYIHLFYLTLQIKNDKFFFKRNVFITF